MRVNDAFSAGPVVWVTMEGPRADALRRDGETVYTLPRFNTQSLNLRNPLWAARLALGLRPRVIITSGAGMAVVFCIVARLLGSRLLFVETMARITSPSLTGRVLRHVSDQTFIQWPDLLRAYPGAVVCRPILLENIDTKRRAGKGTFVSLGTHEAPFDRLLALVDDAVELGLLPAPVVVQSGASTYCGRNFESTPWMSRQEFTQALSASRYAIGHAGAAFAAAALDAGKRPLLLPRKRAFGEHVDGHQDQLAHKLGALGLAVALAGTLSASDLAAADAPLRDDTFDSLGVSLSEALTSAVTESE
jgi:UDP-N-acetylglucosamine--N-acetylmuramyl-(pentapeptide) pyrophosphoryl-undecaprenol N-acetylglucosamine transferase